MKLTLMEVLAACGGTLLIQGEEQLLTRLTTDSRTACPGSLFVPVIGENLDGHRFLGSAIENGASCVLASEEAAAAGCMEKARENGTSVILVEDTVKALQQVGKAARSKVSALTIGVTGSVGKTTTREMIACALSAGKNVFRTGANYNNRLGVPLTLSEIPEDVQIAVLELGLNTPGELSEISSLTDLSCAVITNIGEAHLQYYGTQDNLTREKFTVTDGFTDPEKDPVLVLNADDPYLMKYKDEYPYRKILYGRSENADYRAKELRQEYGNYSFLLNVKGEDLFRVQLSVPGEHNVLNALAALACADLFSVPLEDAAKALETYAGFKGRLKQTEKNGILIVDDSYNASPDSMKAGIKVLSELHFEEGKGRKFAVLGDMLELGDESPRFHYETGAAIADLPVDAFLLTGTLAEEIGHGLSENGREDAVERFSDREALLFKLKECVKPGDIVYVKASHSAGLSWIVEALLSDE